MSLRSWATGRSDEEYKQDSIYKDDSKVEELKTDMESLTTSVENAKEAVSAAIEKLNNVHGVERIGSFNVGPINNSFDQLNRAVKQMSSAIVNKAESINEYSKATGGEVILASTLGAGVSLLTGALGAVEQPIDGAISLVGWGLNKLGWEDGANALGRLVEKDFSGAISHAYYNSSLGQKCAWTEDSKIAHGLEFVGEVGASMAIGGGIANVAGKSIAKHGATKLANLAIKLNTSKNYITAFSALEGMGATTENRLRAGDTFQEASKKGLKSAAITGGLTYGVLGVLGKVAGPASDDLTPIKTRDGKLGLKGNVGASADDVAGATSNADDMVENAAEKSDNVFTRIKNKITNESEEFADEGADNSGKTIGKESGASTNTNKATNQFEDAAGDASQGTGKKASQATNQFEDAAGDASQGTGKKASQDNFKAEQGNVENMKNTTGESPKSESTWKKMNEEAQKINNEFDEVRKAHKEGKISDEEFEAAKKEYHQKMMENHPDRYAANQKAPKNTRFNKETNKIAGSGDDAIQEGVEKEGQAVAKNTESAPKALVENVDDAGGSVVKQTDDFGKEAIEDAGNKAERELTPWEKKYGKDADPFAKAGNQGSPADIIKKRLSSQADETVDNAAGTVARNADNTAVAAARNADNAAVVVARNTDNTAVAAARNADNAAGAAARNTDNAVVVVARNTDNTAVAAARNADNAAGAAARNADNAAGAAARNADNAAGAVARNTDIALGGTTDEVVEEVATKSGLLSGIREATKIGAEDPIIAGTALAAPAALRVRNVHPDYDLDNVDPLNINIGDGTGEDGYQEPQETTYEPTKTEEPTGENPRPGGGGGATGGGEIQPRTTEQPTTTEPSTTEPSTPEPSTTEVPTTEEPITTEIPTTEEPQPPTDITPTEITTEPEPTPIPAQPTTEPTNPGAGGYVPEDEPYHQGGGYTEDTGYSADGILETTEDESIIDETIGEPEDFEDASDSIDSIIKGGSKVTKIPSSKSEISSGSSGSAVIPVIAGLSAAAAAGIGAKAYMDRKNNSDNGEDEDFEAEEWTGEDNLDIDYNDGVQEEQYLDDDSDYGIAEESEEKYDARSNDELVDLQ